MVWRQNTAAEESFSPERDSTPLITAYRDHLKADQYLFLSQRTKTHLTPRGLGFIISKYAGKAGIKALKPHDLRHRFGYWMAEKVPLHRLAQIMGHDSVDTTQLYIQRTPQDLQQAVEQIA